ncbi:hypothetical protein [Plebeiibacterium sediminum]|uniref:Uncharacterized protein n=1 Tax=Plebeiibacterium sediminum TaxID=2992112 RepID=A0AAE3M7D9_9BACT|nr:hypothetical protein [Plebeiobacterium sediminum]MCW3788524.1 hypothetical protein [Plebeiobacterium sediminum]
MKRLNYDSISKELGIDRKVFSPWWDELEEERKYLSMIRDKWLAKCPELDFYEFKDWYENTDKKCYYCEITEDDLAKLWQNHPDLTKRNRGRKLEIERLEPNLPYSVTTNLVFSCYWCNNAKTDTFTQDEFLKVGKVIKDIWKNRLK